MSQDANSGEGNDGNEEGNTPESDEISDTEQSSLDVAAGALNGLTSAMARLQSAGGDALRGELENVVEELRGAADALADQLAGGVSGEDDEPESDSERDEDPASEVKPLLGAVTELVAELRAARTGTPTHKAARPDPGGRRGGAGSSPARDEEDEDEDEEADDDEDEEQPRVRRRSAPKPTPKRKDAAPSGLHSDLRALRTDLKAFSSSLQEQAKRLSRLEKRAGAPSSRPPGERPAPASRSASEASWPLDLNAPPTTR